VGGGGGGGGVSYHHSTIRIEYSQNILNAINLFGT